MSIDVDDFSNLPIDDLGEATSFHPTQATSKANRMLDLLQQASPKALALGKGKSIMNLHDRGASVPAIAEHTGLEVHEVRGVTNVYQGLEPEDKAGMKTFALPKNSVFDLYTRLQEHFEDIKSTMKFMDDPEIKLGYIAELTKLFKLSKDVLADVTFKQKQEADREEETQMILRALNKVDPEAAKGLWKELAEHREHKKLVGG